MWGKRGTKAHDINSHMSLLSAAELASEDASGSGTAAAAKQKQDHLDWRTGAVASSCVLLSKITDCYYTLPDEVYRIAFIVAYSDRI